MFKRGSSKIGSSFLRSKMGTKYISRKYLISNTSGNHFGITKRYSTIDIIKKNKYMVFTCFTVGSIYSGRYYYHSKKRNENIEKIFIENRLNRRNSYFSIN